MMQSVQVGESFVHMITCICMFLLAQGRCECGLWAACKSLRLGGGETRRLILQLFTQPFFFCLDSMTAHKEMFTARTHMKANAHTELSNGESELFLVAKYPENEVPAPRWSLSSWRGAQREVERNSTPAAGSRMTVPCVHLSLEIHKVRLTLPGIHPFDVSACVCVCVCVLKQDNDRAREPSISVLGKHCLFISALLAVFTSILLYFCCLCLISHC